MSIFDRKQLFEIDRIEDYEKKQEKLLFNFFLYKKNT